MAIGRGSSGPMSRIGSLSLSLITRDPRLDSREPARRDCVHIALGPGRPEMPAWQSFPRKGGCALTPCILALQEIMQATLRMGEQSRHDRPAARRPDTNDYGGNANDLSFLFAKGRRARGGF